MKKKIKRKKCLSCNQARRNMTRYKLLKTGKRALNGKEVVGEVCLCEECEDEGAYIKMVYAHLLNGMS